MDIAGFEVAVYRRDHSSAMERLVQILKQLAMQPIQDGTTPAATPAERKVLYSRLAAAISAFLADPETKLGESIFRQLVLMGGITNNIFAASIFGSSDHAMRCMGALPGPGEKVEFSDGQAMAKLHCLYTLDSSAGLDLANMMRKAPAFRLQLFVKYLNSKPILTMSGHERREQLLALGERLEAAPLPDSIDYIVQATNAFMLCSYGEHPRKHACKRAISDSVREWLLRKGVGDLALPAKREIKSRPTMLFASEFMHSKHVQYRYFGQWLRQLRQRFRVVLMTEEGQVDDQCRRLFDDVQPFTRNRDGTYLSSVVSKIKDLRPDVIFYPSVGMKHWGVALSSLRLAPIQLSALGHSASTFCPTVDYYVVEEGYVSDPSLFGEKVILLPDESLRFERASDVVLPTPEIRKNPSPLRVALPSNLMKLNPRFFAMCSRLLKASPRPLEFHAYPNCQHLDADVAAVAVSRWLPNAVVHGVMPYNDYLAQLNTCDLVLSPFPFGGLHSVVDSLRQGLPVIAMECPEPHGRTDAMILRLLGMPSWTIAKTEQEYIDTALRVIGDDETRVQLSHQALGLGINKCLFGDETTPLRREILDTMSWLYENHEMIQSSGRKAWRASDWKARG